MFKERQRFDYAAETLDFSLFKGKCDNARFAQKKASISQDEAFSARQMRSIPRP